MTEIIRKLSLFGFVGGATLAVLSSVAQLLHIPASPPNIVVVCLLGIVAGALAAKTI